MKKRVIILVLAFSLALSLGLAGCTDPQDQLADTMKAYASMLQEGIPEDVTLEIYLTNLHTLYNIPLSVERLIETAEWSTVVKGEELAKHSELLEKLDAAALQPSETSHYINARVYYIFKNGKGEKLLDVVITPMRLSRIEGYVQVNGIAVEWDPVFYQLIEPFLTEEAHEVLGI